jgi:cysteinyl-tRNA synthetase
MMLQTHYRSPLDFSTERLEEARTALERFATMVRTVAWLGSRPATGTGVADADREALSAAIAQARVSFDEDMDDDFNSAGALGAIFDLTRTVNGFLAANEASLAAPDLAVLAQAASAVTELLAVLGVTLPAEGSARALPEGVVVLAAEIAGFAGTDTTGAMDILLGVRAAARAEKDWVRADAVRDGLAKIGVRIEDTPAGARVILTEE